MSDETVSVYALVDPRTGSTFYVGSTVDLKVRLNSHKYWGTAGRDLREMVLSIEEAGLKVEATVLEEAPRRNRDERESYWIEKMRDDGQPLINKRAPSQKGKKVRVLGGPDGGYLYVCRD